MGIWELLSNKLVTLGIRSAVWLVECEIAYMLSDDLTVTISVEDAYTIIDFESLDVELFHTLARSGLGVIASIIVSGNE